MGSVLSNVCQCKVFGEQKVVKKPLDGADKDKQRRARFQTENSGWMKELGPLWFDSDLLLSFYANYESEQDKLSAVWRRIQVDDLQNSEYQKIYNKALNQKWKYLIRKGVSYNKIRPLILDFFKRKYSENEMEYEINFEKVFGKKEAP